jgi:hypothetical protein
VCRAVLADSGARVRVLLGLARLLTLAAWRLRVPGAGPRFAAADDRWRMACGRTPRYGADTHFDATGDEVLSPFAGATDDERREVGLPQRAEVRQRLEDANRRRAEARWSRGGLPDDLSMARVWRPVTAAELEARWAVEGSPVWRDGDVLTVVHRADAEEVRVFPGIQLGMWRVEGDLWALMVRVRDLDRAALSVARVAVAGRQSWGRALPEPVEWRGPDAPATLPAPIPWPASCGRSSWTAARWESAGA